MEKQNYAICIGVGQRRDDAPNMAITVNDAQRVAQELVKIADVDRKHCLLLTDFQADKQSVVNSLETLAQLTQQQSANVVWIYFSGHGVRYDDGSSYLVCNDSENNAITTTALNGIDFVKMLQEIQSDNMIILLDCCHAGGMHQNPIPFEKQSILRLKNRVIISACSPSQTAATSKPLSLFTYALVEAMYGKCVESGKTQISVFDVALYVRERVAPLSKGQQKPGLDVLQNISTTNFPLITFEQGKPIQVPFDEAFKLLDASGKEINRSIGIEQDTDFRNTFNWFAKNEQHVSVIGNVGNVNMHSAINYGNNINLPQGMSAEEVAKFIQLMQSPQHSIQSNATINIKLQNDAELLNAFGRMLGFHMNVGKEFGELMLPLETRLVYASKNLTKDGNLNVIMEPNTYPLNVDTIQTYLDECHTQVLDITKLKVIGLRQVDCFSNYGIQWYNLESAEPDETGQKFIATQYQKVMFNERFSLILTISYTNRTNPKYIKLYMDVLEGFGG